MPRTLAAKRGLWIQRFSRDFPELTQQELPSLSTPGNLVFPQRTITPKIPLTSACIRVHDKPVAALSTRFHVSVSQPPRHASGVELQVVPQLTRQPSVSLHVRSFQNFLQYRPRFAEPADFGEGRRQGT